MLKQILLECQLATTVKRLPMLLILTLPLLLTGGLFFGIWLFLPPSSPPIQLEKDDRSGVPAPKGLLVDVEGAVVNPGLHRVQKGARAYSAIIAAGGLAPDADLKKLPNQAALLKDGELVRVPSQKLTRGFRSSG